MLGKIITIASSGFIASRVFKCMGKKEYAEIMLLCGWIGVGITFLSGLNGIADGIANGRIAGFINWIISLASYNG